MSIVSVDNIQPIGSGTSVTVNSAATLVLNNVNSTGVVTATSLTVNGDVTLGNTLASDEVTFNSKVNTNLLPSTDGNKDLGSSGNRWGEVHAATFHGSGANLTSLPAQATISGNADNRIITGGSGVNLNGEANLTWNGTLLNLTGTGSEINLRGPGVTTHEIKSNTSDNHFEFINNSGAGNITSHIIFKGSGAGGATVSEKMRITTYGVGINTDTGGTSTNAALTISNRVSSTATKLNLITSTSSSVESTQIYAQNNDLVFKTSGNDGLRITADGEIRKPKNPVFIAYRVSNYNLTTSESELVYDSEKLDVGGNYNPSNGRFTAPVTGLYEFGYTSIAKNTQTVYRYTLKVNGNDPYSPLRMEHRIDQNNQTAYGTNGEFVVYVNMTAGQHASVYAKSDTNVNDVYGSSSYGYTYFRGRLIG